MPLTCFPYGCLLTSMVDSSTVPSTVIMSAQGNSVVIVATILGTVYVVGHAEGSLPNYDADVIDRFCEYVAASGVTSGGVAFRSMIGIESLRSALVDHLGFRTLEDFTPTSLIYLPDNVVLPTTPLDDGLTSRSLTPHDADYVNDRWPYRSAQESPMLKDQITNLVSFGVVDTATGALVGWVMDTRDGCFGVLHCEESHRRRGIARFLVVQIAQAMRAVGRPVYAAVARGNEASTALFLSLGFSFVGPEGIWQLITKD